MDPKEPHKQQQQQQQQNQQQPHWMLTGPYGRNAAALMGPTSTSQAMQPRLPLGSTLSFRQPQQPPHWMPTGSYGRNPAALMGPTSTSQAMQHRLSLGSTLSFRQPQQPPHWMLTGSYDLNAAALMGPTSASQAMQHRLSLGSTPSLLQPQQPLGLDGSLSSVVTQQPSMQVGNEQRARRPRGRPRKYADLSSASHGANANSSDPHATRGKGRSPGSCNKKKLNPLEGAGSSFTTHTIHVEAGEDIAAKVMEFMNQEPREVCILSASGAVSSAVLQANDPRGLLKCEGKYYITDLSGSCLNTESNGTVTRTVNLTVCLARSDNSLVGGSVAGRLVAGSPVQVVVVVGSFVRSVENNPETASATESSPCSSESSEPTE